MLKNLKMGKKILLLVLFVLIMSALPTTFNLLHMVEVDREYYSALQIYGFGQGDVAQATVALQNAQSNLSNIITYLDPDEVDNQIKELESNLSDYEEIYRPVLDETLLDDEGKAKLAEIDELYATWKEAVDIVLESRDSLDLTDDVVALEIQQQVVEQFDPMYDKLHDAYYDLFDYKVKTGEGVAQGLQVRSNTALIISIAISIANVLISIIIATIVTRSITKRINLCTERIKRLADGDIYSEVPEAKSKDEVGELTESTKTIVESLSTIIGDVGNGLEEMAKGNFACESSAPEYYKGDYLQLAKEMYKLMDGMTSTLSQVKLAAEQVDLGSDQVSSGAQALAQGSTQQASAVEELSASINEVTEKIKETSQDSKTGKEVNDKASSALQQSMEQMQEMMLAMGQITEKSTEISKIIKAIDDIAFQTNILSLNAAVEAARAGTAGKGFAVVADEVRNLAAKSAQSAKDTAILIEETIAVVENGNKIASGTSESINLVYESAKSLGEIVNNIAAASEEQSIAATQINIGVEQISAVVQTNSATAEQSAAASEELSGQSNMLKELISGFTLRDSANANIKIVDDEDTKEISDDVFVEYDDKY